MKSNFLQKKFVVSLLLTLCLILLAQGLAVSAPALAGTPPRSSISWYVGNLTGNFRDDFNTMYNRGCADAGIESGYNLAVVLDFGGQQQNSSSTWGTIEPSWPTQFIPNGDIQNAVEGYIAGFYGCSSPTTTFNVLIGTNNNLVVNGTAAQQWASNITAVNKWISSNNYSSRADAYGASDIELAWSPPSNARAWASNFYGSWYFNYGDANSCPSAGTGNCYSGYWDNDYDQGSSNCNCANDTSDDSDGDGETYYSWAQSDVGYVSWGASSAYSLPEIYYNAPPYAPVNAEQWEGINVFGANGFMRFNGSLTQYGACLQKGGCSNTNQPDQGWTELSNASGENPPWVTDISWM